MKRPTIGESLTIIGWAVLAIGQFALYRQNMNPDPRVLIQTAGDGWSVLNDGTRSNIWSCTPRSSIPPQTGTSMRRLRRRPSRE